MSQQNIDQGSKWKRIVSDTIGYGVFAATLAILFFFLVLPVGVIIGKAFYYNGSFSLEYFQLLFAGGLVGAKLVSQAGGRTG